MLRKPEALSRARYIPQSTIDQYDLLEQTLQDNGLEDHPELLFNCDETGILLDHLKRRLLHQQPSSTRMSLRLEIRHTSLCWHVSVLRAKYCLQWCYWKGSTV